MDAKTKKWRDLDFSATILQNYKKDKFELNRITMTGLEKIYDNPH